MTTTPPAYRTPPTRWGAGRIVALVFGVLLLLPGLALATGGGLLLVADQGARTDGFLFSSPNGFSTEGFALTSDRIDLSTGASWLPVSAALGSARAEVTPADRSTAIFVGVAPAAEASAYLGGVARTVITDLGTGSSDERVVPGAPPTGAPGDQTFWVAQASGTGTQRLDWTPTQGDWVFVVMNADGSAGVAMDARIGATVPALGGLAWGVLAGGLLLVVVGLLLLVLAIRRPRGERSYTGGPYVTPPVPAPSWAPPAPIDRTTAANARHETPQWPPT